MISNNTNDDVKKMLTSAEATKIYNEIHQLRNHQFYITFAAITFFGVALSKMVDSSICNNIQDLNYKVLILLILQGIFLGLFYWLTGLSKLIAILSVYLKITLIGRMTFLT